MGSILALLNVLFIGDLEDPELCKLMGLETPESKADRVETLGLITRQVRKLFLDTQADKHIPISSNGKAILLHPWEITKEVYRILSRMEADVTDNINCLPLAHIVLAGTPEKPVPLTVIHLVNQMVKSHNLLGNPTKVQLIVTDLREIAVF